MIRIVSVRFIGIVVFLGFVANALPQEKTKVEKLGSATGITYERIREVQSGRMVEREAGKDRVFLVVRAKVTAGKLKPYADFKLTETGKAECFCRGIANSEHNLLGSFQDFYPSDEVALVGGGDSPTIILCYSVPRAYKTPVSLQFRGKETVVKIITELDFEVECLSHPDEKTREKAALCLGSRAKKKDVAMSALKKAMESEKSGAVKEQITKSIGLLEKGN